MKENHIVFNGNERIEEYLKGIFHAARTEYHIAKNRGLTEIIFRSDEEFREKIICGILTNFYKLKEILKRMPRSDNRAFYALVGALIGLEQEEDIRLIYEGLENNDVVNLDGFYNFCLNDLRESWSNLSVLSSKLYAQCKDEGDVFALSVFMMGMDDRFDSAVVVDGHRLRWEKSGVGIAIVPYFGNPEADFIATLLSQRPSDVVVLDPANTSENILNVIRAIGE